MKQINKLLLLSVFILGGLFTACQKDDALNQDQQRSGDLKEVNIDCDVCVETWEDTQVIFNSTYFVPQSPNIGLAPADLELAVWNDATTVYYHIYRTAGTIQHLSIDGQVIVTYGDPAITEYSWQTPLAENWQACDDINNQIVVGGVTFHGGHFTANICYYLRDICETECNGPTETAWVAGERYTDKGNWATYTMYVADATVDIYAGQHINVGTAHFSAIDNGMVTITIELVNGWQFNDVPENLKIMGYSSPPSGNPSPGQFPYKYDESGSTATVTIPAWAYYGIHLDVQLCNQY